jgi:hypothetical protein
LFKVRAAVFSLSESVIDGYRADHQRSRVVQGDFALDADDEFFQARARQRVSDFGCHFAFWKRFVCGKQGRIRRCRSSGLCVCCRVFLFALKWEKSKTQEELDLAANYFGCEPAILKSAIL